MKNKIDWTIEEEYILFESRVALGGNHWSSIATFLRGRIANNVKNHFYSGLFVAIRSFKKNKLEICKKFFSLLFINTLNYNVFF